MKTQIDEGHRTISISLKQERQNEKEKWKVQMKGHNQADVKTVTNKEACDREKSNLDKAKVKRGKKANM